LILRSFLYRLHSRVNDDDTQYTTFIANNCNKSLIRSRSFRSRPTNTTATKRSKCCSYLESGHRHNSYV